MGGPRRAEEAEAFFAQDPTGQSLARFPGGWWQVTDNRRFPIDEPHGEVVHLCKLAFAPFAASGSLDGEEWDWFQKSEAGELFHALHVAFLSHLPACTQ
jgi:hypothetical protein